MQTTESIDSRWLWGAILALVVVCYFLAPVLTPFVAGALLAYLGDPIVDQMERWRLNRTLAVILVFAIFGFIALLLVLLLFPMVARQFAYLTERLPTIITWLQKVAIPRVEKTIGVELGSFDLLDNKDLLISAWQYSGDYVEGFIKNLTKSGLAIFALLGNLVLTPIVAFYLLRDWDILMDKIRGLIPRQYASNTVSLFSECDERLGAFLRGQLLVMLVLGIIYAAGMWMLGLDLALLIGLLSGLASIIPYLGFAVGIVAASIVAFFQFHDVLHMLMVWGVFIIGQLLEGSILTPLLVGDRIGLHPVAVIFAILAGGELFGFLGMLLALPVAAASMVFLEHARRRYLSSRMYVGKADSGQETE